MKPSDTDRPVQRVVHRVVFPADADPSTLPLYVDEREQIGSVERAPSGARETREAIPRGGDRPTSAEPVLLGTTHVLSDVERTAATIGPRSRVSFATYFNAFPAAYWRQWTTVDSVRLTLDIDGEATVSIYRSTVRGTMILVETITGATGLIERDLSLKKFGDGGWLWFDLETHLSPARVRSASWSADASLARRDGRGTIAVTTYNRPDDCVTQMERIADSPALLERLDRVIFVDQGSSLVADATGYETAASRLGDVLEVIRQPNLGGSGGFARGMHEAVSEGSSDYVLLLDDDIVVETESMLRMFAFADFTRKPTIVGGHMLSLHERSLLHSYGESVNLYRTMWHSVDPSLDAFDFAGRTLRSTPALHARIDVDFNAWWMCLIPTDVVREIGLSLPVFIKWDDAEYGLRAGRAGVPTVSLPGAAVWHMPWTEKDDRLDWQAYFHQRNRWLVGLLYSPYRSGGSLLRESFATDVKHLLSLQYSSVALRNRALRDLLRGPSHLHATIHERAAEMRKLHSTFPDGAVLRDIEKYPDVQRVRPLRKGRRPAPPRGIVGWVLRAGLAGVRHLLVPTRSTGVPEDRVPAPDARWWRLSGVDAALVSTADATGVSHYRRDRARFRALLRDSLRLHLALRRRWPQLERDYRRALPQITSPEAWSQTFGRGADA